MSGFIITFVTRESVDDFLVKRFVRVVPLYWLASFVFFFFASFGIFNVFYTVPTWISLAKSGNLIGFLSNQASANLTPQAWLHVAESFLFIPASRAPVLGVGWTLNYEMLFYCLFGLSIIVTKRWSPLLVIFVLVLIRIGANFYPCGPVCSTYGSPTMIFFIAGILVYYIWIWLRATFSRWRRAMLIIAPGYVVVFAAVCIMWKEPPSNLFLALVAGAVLVALISEEAGLICRNRFLLALGDSSYSLYLTHLFVIETMRVVGSQIAWLDQSKSTPVMLASIAMSIALAFAVHYGVEKPMLRAMRRWTSRGKPQPATSAA